MTLELDGCLPMGIPYSILLKWSLSLEENDVLVSAKEGDVE